MDEQQKIIYTANNYVKEIKELKEDIENIYAISDKQKEEITQKANNQVEKLQSKIDYLKNELFLMQDSLKMKETKTTKKKIFLDGELVIKKEKLDFLKDDKSLLPALEKDKEFSTFIKKQEVKKINWADLKKKLEITSDGEILVKETGEILELKGLNVIKKDSEIDVI